MIRHNSTCVRNLKVGDSVVLRLLPYDEKYLTFEHPITFPIIGFRWWDKIPLVGTMDKKLYDNHHFVRAIIYDSTLDKCTYCMALDAPDIQIEKIIRRVTSNTFNSSHIQK